MASSSNNTSSLTSSPQQSALFHDPALAEVVTPNSSLARDFRRMQAIANQGLLPASSTPPGSGEDTEPVQFPENLLFVPPEEPSRPSVAQRQVKERFEALFLDPSTVVYASHRSPPPAVPSAPPAPPRRAPGGATTTTNYVEPSLAERLYHQATPHQDSKNSLYTLASDVAPPAPPLDPDGYQQLPLDDNDPLYALATSAAPAVPASPRPKINGQPPHPATASDNGQYVEPLPGQHPHPASPAHHPYASVASESPYALASPTAPTLPKGRKGHVLVGPNGVLYDHATAARQDHPSSLKKNS